MVYSLLILLLLLWKPFNLELRLTKTAARRLGLRPTTENAAHSAQALGSVYESLLTWPGTVRLGNFVMMLKRGYEQELVWKIFLYSG